MELRQYLIETFEYSDYANTLLLTNKSVVEKVLKAWRIFNQQAFDNAFPTELQI